MEKYYLSCRNCEQFAFDLDKESSGYHIVKRAIHEGLFGFLKNVNPDELTKDFEEAIELSSQTKTTKTKQNKPTLEQQLKEALDREDYEKAAEIRDILNQTK